MWTQVEGAGVRQSSLWTRADQIWIKPGSSTLENSGGNDQIWIKSGSSTLAKACLDAMDAVDVVDATPRSVASLCGRSQQVARPKRGGMPTSHSTLKVLAEILVKFLRQSNFRLLGIEVSYLTNSRASFRRQGTQQLEARMLECLWLHLLFGS